MVRTVSWCCVAALAFLSVPVTALAQVGRVYITLDGGAVMIQDKRGSAPSADLKVSVKNPSLKARNINLKIPDKNIDIKYDFNMGMAISPVLGYRLDNGLLFETELNYLQFSGNTSLDFKDIPGGGLATGPLAFRTALPYSGIALTPMLNIGYEPDIGGPFTGYAKVGVGYSHTWASYGSDLRVGNKSGSYGVTKHDLEKTFPIPADGGGFAYQGIVGVAWKPADNSRVSLDYRHLRLGGSGRHIATHQVKLGLTHQFGGASDQQ